LPVISSFPIAVEVIAHAGALAKLKDAEAFLLDEMLPDGIVTRAIMNHEPA
jgi:hypothetical protein